jgi:DNA-binding NarL/FixJ family response regulator
MSPLASGSPAPTPASITVALARFDDLLAGGLRKLIEGDASLEVVADNIEHRRVPVVLRALRPDVAILDVGALEKLAEVRELAIRNPHTRLVLLADELSTIECAQLLAFGASACLGRDTQSRDVLNAIHLASRGLQLTPRAPGAADARLAGGQLLTPREAEVLPLLQQGRSNPQIAIALQVGVETVRTHARNIYRKLGVSSRRELSLPPAGERDRRAQAETRAGHERAVRRPPRSRRGHGLRRG